MAATATITACSRAGISTSSARAGCKLYDFAALVPVVEGAGGRMCDWNGDPLTAASAGHVLAIGDPARTDDVLEALHARWACRSDH